MIDKSILARCCAPDGDVVPTVLLNELRDWAFEVVDGAALKAALVDWWAAPKYREPGNMRDSYGVQSAVHGMLSKGLEREIFIPRVFDGERAWRLPARAFEGFYPAGRDLEMTWTTGRLWELDASTEFRAVAELRLPLLVTVSEADAFKATVTAHIEQLSAPARDIDPEQLLAWEVALADKQRRWLSEWSARKWWPAREALLWVALGSLDDMAHMLLTSVWTDDDVAQGLGGSVWVSGHLEAHAQNFIYREPNPEPALMSALRSDRIAARGVFDGELQDRAIEGDRWEFLELGVCRKSMDGSAARRIAQLAGVNWSGHWTQVRFSREDLQREFPPRPLTSETEAATKALTTDEAMALLDRLIAQNGGFISQDKGAEAVREVDPLFDRAEARRLTKLLTGNNKRGRPPKAVNPPEGTRTNLAPGGFADFDTGGTI